MKKRMAALAACTLLTAGFISSCAEKEKKVETVTESTTTEPVVVPAPDTVKMDTAAPMPVKTTN